MKRTLITMLVCIISMTMSAQSRKQTSSGSKRPVYYVVVGSYENLEAAIDYNQNGPADTTCGNVYKAVKNGQTLYRICDGCYYSKAKAQRQLREIKAFYQEWRGVTPWIWTNQGEAPCVDRGCGNDGTYYRVRPE